MKKLIITLLVLGSLCVNVFAQDVDDVVDTNVSTEIDFRHNEVYLSGGTTSLIGAFSGFFVVLGQGFADAVAKNKEENPAESYANAPAFGLTAGYNYFFNKHFAVGGMTTYEKFLSMNLFSLQAKLTAQYGWTHFKIYHSASAGFIFIPEADNPFFIFDLTYIGLKFDFDRFNIFIEGSVPSTSLLKLGASFKF